MHNHAFRVLGLPATRMTIPNTKSPLSVQIYTNGLADLLANYYIFRVLDVFKAGDRGRYEYIELNDYHLKAVNGRPVIMRVFLWDQSYALLAARPARHIQ